MRAESNVTRVLVFAAVLVFGAFAPYDYIYYVQVLSLAGILTIQALGLNLLLGGAGQISLGQVGFMAVGAYVGGALSKIAGWPFLFSLGSASLVSGALGLLVGYGALRLRGQYLAMATLAFAGIIHGLVNEIQFTGGPMGMLRIPPMSLFGFDLLTPNAKYLFIWTLAALVTFCVIRLMRSRVGQALAAIRSDEIAATVLGIDVARYKLSVFVFAAVLSGAAGAIYASYLGGIAPARFGVMESIGLLIVVVIGGLGSISGTVISSILLTIIPELMRDYEPYRPLAFAAVLILLILFFPSGLGGLVRQVERLVRSLAAAAVRGQRN
jgi:branched-chain amino acid transport system permease protein